MNKYLVTLLMAIFYLQCTNSPNDSSLTIYTHRHYDVDKEIFANFEKEMGVKINVVNASADELIQRIESEGDQTPADLLITVDAGRLVRAKEKNLFQSFNSSMIDSTIPANFKDSENQWVGITKRARVIVYSKERVDPSELTSYEDLTDGKWKNRILVRSSGNIYNQSLMSSLISANGEDNAMNWAKEITNNFAREPKGNDRDQVKAILAKEGDIAIVNTYYIGRLLNSDDELERRAGNAVNVFFPNQEDRGTHINISGIGIIKNSKKVELATLFIEYLLSKDVQEQFATANYEYPINSNASSASVLEEWGDFKEDTLPLQRLGELNKEAVMVFDRAGWP